MTTIAIGRFQIGLSRWVRTALATVSDALEPVHPATFGCLAVVRAFQTTYTFTLGDGAASCAAAGRRGR